MNAVASSLMLIHKKTNEFLYEVPLDIVREKLRVGQGISGTVAQAKSIRLWIEKPI